MTFKANISDESFSFHEHPFHDRKVTGAQIAEAVRAHPLGDFVVIRQLPSLELEALRPTELADLEDSTRFFVIRGTDAYGFEVDGLSMVWPQKALSGLTVKRLVMKEGADIELRLEREDEADRVIGDSDPVQLTDEGIESFKTRPARVAVTIVVEGTPHRWEKEKISYAEVVTLEVPDYPLHPEITYSVKFTDGPGDRPEGVLAKGALVKVKVKDGMVFSVSETGQS